MKLYAVTKGCYSDYHIITLTTSKERAKRMAVLYSDRFEEAKVEEYEEGDLNDSRIPYDVYFYNNGYVAAYAKCLCDFAPGELMRVIAVDSLYSQVEYSVCVLANSMEHAIKIACDELAQYKCEKEGI